MIQFHIMNQLKSKQILTKLLDAQIDQNQQLKKQLKATQKDQKKLISLLKLKDQQLANDSKKDLTSTQSNTQTIELQEVTKLKQLYKSVQNQLQKVRFENERKDKEQKERKRNLDNKIQKLEQDLIYSNQKCINLIQHNNRFQKQITSLKQLLEQANKRQQSKLISLKKQIGSLKQELINSNNEINCIRTRQQEWLCDKLKLQKEKQDIEQKLLNYKKQDNKNKQENKKLIQQSMNIKSELNNLKADLMTLEDQKNNLQYTLNFKQQEISQKDKLVQTFRRKSNQSEKQLIKIREQLQEKKKLIDQQSDETINNLNKIRLEYQKSQQHNNFLKQQIVSLNNEMQECLFTYQQKFQKQTKSLAQIQQHCQKLELELGQLKNLLEKQKKQTKRLKKIIQQVEKENKRISHQRIDQQNYKQKEKQQIKKMAVELHQAKLKIDQLTNNVNSLSKRNSQQKNQILSFNKFNSCLKQENQGSKAELRMIKNEKGILQSKLVFIIKQLQQKNEQVKQLKNGNQILSQSLEKKLNQQKELEKYKKDSKLANQALQNMHKKVQICENQLKTKTKKIQQYQIELKQATESIQSHNRQKVNMLRENTVREDLIKKLQREKQFMTTEYARQKEVYQKIMQDYKEQLEQMLQIITTSNDRAKSIQNFQTKQRFDSFLQKKIKKIKSQFKMK